MGDLPFMIYLGGSKKRASLTVDFLMTKTRGAIPFGKAALKKCN
jgi:hypothetical protein